MSTQEGTALQPVVLGPGDSVPERPFTAVDLIDRDMSILYEILGDIRGVLTEAAAGTRSIVPFHHMVWKVDGMAHRHIVCDEERLRLHPELCAVGFFGELRTGVDMTPLEEANTAVVAEFVKYPGITSYSSLELPDGHWANLVLHDDPVDTEYWRKSEMHAQAVKLLAPVHYNNVRIHNAELSAGVFEDPTIVVKRTKYFDYTADPGWMAERALGG